MDSPAGQAARKDGAANRDRGGSTPTRQRLLRAAAELIAELGWGQVTTRAIAQRAGLPHGSVSYHFRGKQDLLTEAALETVTELAPMDELADADALPDLLSLVTAWVSDIEGLDPVRTGVLMEVMRESVRNTVLRDRMATLLQDYRRLLVELLSREERRAPVPPGVTPSALATLLAAAGDGLLLHALLDPELDAGEATGALRVLLTAPELGGAS